MEKGSNKLSKTFWILTLILCILCIAGISIGFYFYKKETNKVIVKDELGGDVYLKYVGNTNGLTLLNASPMTDQLGALQDGDNKYFDFSVEVDLDEADFVEYEIAIVKDKSFSNIPDNEVKFYLEEENSGSFSKVFGPSEFKPLEEKTELGTDKGDMVLYTVKKADSGTINYRLRMWMAETSTMPVGNYSVEVSINGKAN